MNIIRVRKRARNQGYAIAETTAAMAIFIPLICLMVYAVWQATMYIFIVTTMAEAARTAARSCAIAYGAPAAGPLSTADSQGPNVALPQPDAVFVNPTTTVITGADSTGVAQPYSPNEVFGSIRMPGVVDHSSQFTAYYTSPAPNNQDPGYSTGNVKVVVKYNGTFPSPDVLGLQAVTKSIKMESAFTYPLEF